VSELIQVDVRIPGVWNAVKPYLENAIEKTCFSDIVVDDVRPLCANGQAKLWVVVNHEQIIGAGVTTLKTYPRRAVLEVALFSADANSEMWSEHFGELVQHAREVGAVAISLSGREGWARKLQRLGAKVTVKQVVEIDLEEN
jgi:hypothetical protein